MAFLKPGVTWSNFLLSLASVPIIVVWCVWHSLAYRCRCVWRWLTNDTEGYG